MKWTVIAAIILAVVLAGIDSKHGASPAPTAPASSTSTPTGAVHPVGSSAVQDGDVSAVCDAAGKPVSVSPNTAAGRARAAQLCASVNSDAATVASKLNAMGQ